MTEEEARAWVDARFGSVTTARLAVFVDLVAAENERQNLVSPATLPSIWARHIVDSLQLIALGSSEGRWLDIGTGGGFPGLVVAVAGRMPMTLAEPRRRRADFLQRCVDELDCLHVDIFAGKVENLRTTARTISARAVASVENLLRAAGHCATTGTRWLLPRGTIDRAQLATIARQHHLVFHVEQSVTHPESSIVVFEAQ